MEHQVRIQCSSQENDARPHEIVSILALFRHLNAEIDYVTERDRLYELRGNKTSYKRSTHRKAVFEIYTSYSQAYYTILYSFVFPNLKICFSEHQLLKYPSDIFLKPTTALYVQ